MLKFIFSAIVRLLAWPRLTGTFLLFITTGVYLCARKWTDVQKEKARDIEIVREGEEYLGTWGHQSETGYIAFRLHRNGVFTCKIEEAAAKNMAIRKGHYKWLPLRAATDINRYPRIIAIDARGDTIFNYFVAYVTPYDSKTDKTDRMVLTINGRMDTTGIIFFRLE